VFGRPRCRDPVGDLVVRAAGRESRETGHGVHVKLVGEFDRLPEFGVGLARPLVVGMQRVVVGRQRRDVHVVLVERGLQVVLCVGVVEDLPAGEVVVAWEPATAEFDGVDAQVVEIRE